uniref:Fibrinogen C-terminal domain-containing protein n=1 Tax=Ciona savignyi TaxID=51511 RepID=H2YBY4_CIOSA
SASQKGEVGWPGKRGPAGSVGPKGNVGAVVLTTDCKVAQYAGNNVSGIYNITRHGNIFQVFCDMKTDEGGWTVFQRRIIGEQDFFLNWDEYRRGFGNINKEFWIGLDDLHSLTSHGNFELRIDLKDCENRTQYAKYRPFKVLGPSTNYQLQVTGFQGSMRDSLSYHNGRPFSTKDQDNDSHSSSNCAVTYQGGWWNGACHDSNLNGPYLPCVNTPISMNWHNGTGHFGYRFSEMKFRPY